MLLAFNVSSEQFESVPPYASSVEHYYCHKPHAEPYQDASMKARVLWHHKKDNYFIWTAGKAVLKMDMEEGPDALVGTEVGDVINAYKLDKASYAHLLQKHKAGAVANTSTSTSTKSGKKRGRVSWDDDDDDLDAIDRNAGVRVDVGTSSSKKKARSEEDDAEGGVSGMEVESGSCSFGMPSSNVDDETVVMDTGDNDADGKDAESKDAEAKDAEGKDAEGKDAEGKDAEGKDAEGKDAKGKDAEGKDAENNRLEALQRDLAVQQKRAEEAERKHKAYMQRKQREMKTLVSQDSLDRAKAETEEAKAELMKARTVVSLVSDEDRQALIASKKNPRVCYLELIRVCTERLKELIRNLSVPVDKPDGEQLVFEFWDNKWIELTDKTVVGALSLLYNDSMKMAEGHTNEVSYSFGGHTYTTTLVVGEVPVIDAVAEQRNDNTNVVRSIRAFRRVGGPSGGGPSFADPHKNFKVLFGSESIVPLDDDFVESMLKELRFDVDLSYEMSRDLAELVEMHSSLASKFKYCVDAGTVPTSKDAPHFVSHTDGEKDFNSELFIKPMALFNWLSIARARGYKAARILLHGCRHKAYLGMRADCFGFDMEFAGKNGQAYGTGVYCGLSDHATVNYNNGSGFAPGSCMVALLLTKESIGWQHHHGGYSKANVESSTQYKTLGFSSPEMGTDNAIVVHETPLLLQLGHVRAFDSARGWVGTKITE